MRNDKLSTTAYRADDTSAGSPDRSPRPTPKKDGVDVASMIRERRGHGSRKVKDGIANGFTWLATGIAVFVLAAVFVFVFRRGASMLSPELITRNYYAENIMINYEDPAPGNFTAPEDLPADSHFSPRFGVALRDGKDPQGRSLLEVAYMDGESPLAAGRYATAGPRQGEETPLPAGASLRKFTAVMDDGSTMTVGQQARMDAEASVAALEADGVVSVKDAYYQTEGGGIRGSLIATLLLIGLTILIALPLGILAAVYLNEIAKPGKITAAFRTSIELLSGVPSIIFSLVGISMLFPITAIFGVTSTSIILGAMTMSIVLLPVIIRQTEEALIVVPDGLRMSSLSLGATRTQTIFRVVLPNALPGILSATLLSISRVIGESAALIFTMGTSIVDRPEVDKGATTLAVMIWSIMSSDQPNFELASAISILILVVVLILNLSVKLVSYRLNRKWR